MTNMQFDRFRLDSRRRELLADGIAVPIGSRAIDILMVLIEARGELVTKDELLSRVWPRTVVEENTLQFQISAIRKALGGSRDLIKTISGRGYRFVAEITPQVSPDSAVASQDALPARQDRESTGQTNLPARLSDLIGRETELAELADLAAAHRLVTLTGAGGVGKTRLGLELARRQAPKFADGMWVVALAPLSDPELVLPTVAGVLDLPGDLLSHDQVAAAIGSKHVLLVLDNCEHVIDAAARIAEAFLHAGAMVQVIATSREPLRVDGECVYPVPSLEVPAEGIEDFEDVSRHSAVKLFVARAKAAEPRLSFDARFGTTMAKICRRLDGIPLAIEFAASRAAAIGIEELAAGLDQSFDLLTRGRRTALPRHQTLRATLDWSHALLIETERVVLRRLAIFAGGFLLDAAMGIAASAEITAPDVVDGLGTLVLKSLVTADVGGSVVRYRLLETTRAYMLEKLTGGGERDEIARRHAEYYRNLFQHAAVDSETRPAAEWIAVYGPDIDNVRSALDWAFSPSGDPAAGVALTIASVPHWFRLSRMEECRGRVERALACVAAGSGPGSYAEMQLLAAHALSLTFVKGYIPEAGAAWANALKIAEALGETDYQSRAQWGLWAYLLARGEFRAALALAEQFSRLAENASDPADKAVGDRMVGFSLHYLGNQTEARRHIERMLEFYPNPAPASHTIRFLYEPREIARTTLARVLWLQGFPDQAMDVARSTVENALLLNHEPSICNNLALAGCQIALIVGDLATAESFVAMLVERSARHALKIWPILGRCFKGMLLIKQGATLDGLRHLITGVDELRAIGFSLSYTMFLGTLAEHQGEAGQIAGGFASIDEAIERSERNEELWCLPELIRVRGALILSEDAPSAAATAEEHFHRAIDHARQQGTLSWELRAAMSLARLWHEQGRTMQSRELLALVYDRFTEGHGTADLKAARSLLAGFGEAGPRSA